MPNKHGGNIKIINSQFSRFS